MSPSPQSPLVLFDATLASLAPLAAKLLSPVDFRSQKSLAPRLSSSALQHVRMKKPFVSLFSKRPKDLCPAFRKSPPQGLATLSGIFVSSPWGTSFSSQRSWASLFRAFLLSGDRKTLSDLSLRSCASLQTLDGFGSALQRLPPTRKAVPLSAPQRISSGRGLLLS